MLTLVVQSVALLLPLPYSPTFLSLLVIKVRIKFYLFGEKLTIWYLIRVN